MAMRTAGWNSVDVPFASSNYPIIDSEHTRSGYSIRYSPTLAKTFLSYLDSKKELPDGFRMSTAAEELAIKLAMEKEGKELEDSDAFHNLFKGGAKGYWFDWQWTETGLRVPKGYKEYEFEKDKHGRKLFRRIVLIGNEEKGEILIPEASGNIVTEFDEVFGIPTTVSESPSNHEHDNDAIHFCFLPRTSEYHGTGMEDITVSLDMYVHQETNGARCLALSATDLRHGAGGYGGYRLVKGILPLIGAKMTVPENPIAARLERMEKDFNEMEFEDFQEKYRL